MKSVENTSKTKDDVGNLGGGSSKVEKPKQIVSTIVEDLRVPVESIIRDLKDSIDNGSYGLLIGDDVSARPVALLIRGIVDKAYKAADREDINTRFVPLYSSNIYNSVFDSLMTKEEKIRIGSLSFGRRGEEKSLILKQKLKEDFISKLDKKNLTGKKVLVISDVIQYGDTLRPLLAGLKEEGISFDVVTVTAMNPGENGQLVIGSGADNFYYAQQEVHSVYGKSDLAGVKKDQEKFKITSEPRKASFEDPAMKTQIQDSIKNSRADIKNLAEQIFNKVWAKQ
ncbi:MAG: hypothetical protein AAB965_01010 [Patescibacteria group bacterium]